MTSHVRFSIDLHTEELGKRVSKLIQAAKDVRQDLALVWEEQHRKLVRGQTLESAAKNWKGLGRSVDLGPLLKALESLEELESQ